MTELAQGRNLETERQPPQTILSPHTHTHFWNSSSSLLVTRTELINFGALSSRTHFLGSSNPVLGSGLGALLYRAYSSSLNSILEFSSGAMLKLRFGSFLKLTEPSFGALRVHFWGSLHSASLENTEQNLGAHYILRALFHRAYFGFQDTPSSLYKIQFWNSSSSLLV